MEQVKPIRVGVVGAGGNTRAQHIPKLLAIPGVKLVGVVNRSRESSQRVADEFGIPRVYDSWEQLVRSPEVDAVVIGTWPYLHCPVTLAAFDAGKHVMCEARMAMDLGEAVRMYRASRQHPELVAQIVPCPFTLHVNRSVSRLIREGYLGELLAIELRAMAPSYLDASSPLQWRQDKALSGINIMSLGIWYEALLRWVGEATRVSARGKVFVRERFDAARGQEVPCEIPEHLVVSAEMACGACCSMVVSSVAGHLSGPAGVHLFGAEGTLCFENGVLYGARKGDGALGELELPQHEVIGWRVEEEFVGAIRGSEAIENTTFADGVRYMAFTEGVARSLQHGGAPEKISCGVNLG